MTAVSRFDQDLATDWGGRRWRDLADSQRTIFGIDARSDRFRWLDVAGRVRSGSWKGGKGMVVPATSWMIATRLGVGESGLGFDFCGCIQ